jgi:outer membrane assembly lipoprotein YfiO
MKLTVRLFIFCLMLIGSWGCSQKSAKLQKSVVPPDKTLFETGSGYLEKSQFIKARLAFQTLINTYPDSEMAADSYFAIGDSFYNEGGTENLLLAEDQYKNFIVFFPTHPRVADAQMKIIAANMKMIRAPDRDRQYTYRSEQEIKSMIEQFPDSDYAPIARQLLVEVQEVLAEGDLGIGKFYADKNNFGGAIGRFRGILEKYPDYSRTDEVLYLMASSLEKSHRPEEAVIYYDKIASGFPFSKWFDEAKARLNSLGKPLPPVDTQLAAMNESRLKTPDGFSPLKPFIDFGKALGFVSAPDQYEKARRVVEEEKGRTAEAAPGEGGSEDNILIQTIIRKSPSGETKDTTVLGSVSGDVLPEEADQSKDKSKDK